MREAHPRTSSVRSAALAVTLALLAGPATRLFAQGTTGKIEGTVHDQGGAPIAGAQVLIIGSAFGGITNERGYYFINNVPAGVMAVRGQYIGYAPAEVRNVRVFAGQTMTVNLVLDARPTQLEALNVTVEANPIVPRDQVATKPLVAGDLIEHLPADDIQQVLRLQPGVVESNRGLSIRGGRVGEAPVYVDGVEVRSISGNTGLGTGIVGTNALEEASVITGAIGADFGDAQSGVISLVTRSGGPTVRGTVSFSTDELSGDTYGSGTNRLEASLGGPLAHRLSFFVATTLQGQQSQRLGVGATQVPLYVLDGVDTVVTVATTPRDPLSDSVLAILPAFARYSHGQRRPGNSSDAWTADAKLQYSFGAGSRLSATFHHTRQQGLTFPGSYLYDPVTQQGALSTSSALILAWAQNLTRTNAHALFLDTRLSVQHERSITGIVDPDWMDAHRQPFAWFTPSTMRFLTTFDNFPIDERLIRNVRLNTCFGGRDAARPDVGACIPYLGRNDLAASGSYRTNPYGLPASYFPTTGYATGQAAFGFAAGVGLNEETRYTGSIGLDWQVDRYNRVRAGGDFIHATAVEFGSSLTQQIFMDANRYRPTRIGLYVTDRLDLGDVVVDLGLRYDRLRSGVLYQTPGFGLGVVRSLLQTGDVATAFGRASNATDSALIGGCVADLQRADTLALSSCILHPGAIHQRLLPSLRIAFPITDRTGFRLSYAQQAQTPDFILLAQGVNGEVGNGNSIRGADLDFARTILFEFGVRHAFSADLVLDIAGYAKNKVSDVSARIVQDSNVVTGRISRQNLMTNADFGLVRGVDVKLDWRVGTFFQVAVAYTHESARSTGSDPFEYLTTLGRQIGGVTGDRTPPPQALLTTRDNRTHTLAGSVALTLPPGWHRGSLVGALLHGTGVFGTFRFASGLAYTRIVNAGAGTRGPGNGFGLVGTGLEALNGSTMPWIRNVDLRLTRSFFWGQRDVTVFADFRNLFNWANLIAVYAETGDVVNQRYFETQSSPLVVNLHSEAGSLYQGRLVTVSGASQTIHGVDLSDCTQYNPADGAGLPNCLMLRRTEQRFGNGDRFLTDDEFMAAISAWYNLFRGPYTLRGPGLNLRLGVELNF